MTPSGVKQLGKQLASVNIPNRLTLLRIVLTPIYLLLLAFPIAHMGVYPAFIVYLAAAITDLLDGYIARKYALTSDAGKFLDPIADKLFVILPLIWFTYTGAVQPWLTMVIVARELIISGFRLVGAAQGVVLAAGIMGKAKTVSQIILLGTLTLGWRVPSLVMGIIAAALTVVSGAEYLYRNRALLGSLR